MDFEEIMEYYNPNRQVYNFIKRDKENLLPFIGAGLSAFSYSTWAGTLELLYNSCPRETQPKIKNLLDQRNFERAADAILKAIGPLQFFKALRVIFDEKDIDDTKLVKEAVALVPPLFGPQAITTNFDKIVERAYKLNSIDCEIAIPQNIKKINIALRDRKASCLFKIHGDLYSDDEDIVFTGASYKKHYSEGTDLIKSLRDWMKSRPLLFLGTSLQFDRTMKVLLMVAEKGMDNYAIIGCKLDKIKKFKSELEKKFIMAIFYPEGEYSCVRVILEKLLEEADSEYYNKLPYHINSLIPKYNRFDYRAEKTEFLDREKELNRLKAFIDSDKPVTWWAITGEGGSGKSRLASEFSKLVGIQWDVKFLRSSDYRNLTDIIGRISRNTMLVLDSIQAYADIIGNLLKELSESTFTSRIRLLLIERDDAESIRSSWLDILMDTAGRNVIEDLQYDKDLLKLQPLSPKTLKSIISSYAAKNNKALDEFTIDRIYKSLERIDPELVRPLYGMFITDAHINGKDTNFLSEIQILQYIYNRECDMLNECIRQSFGITKTMNKPLYKRIYCLKIIASAIGKLILPDDAIDICGNIWDCIKNHLHCDDEELCEKLYNTGLARKTYSENGDMQFVMSAQQPDIIWEYFFWSLFISSDMNMPQLKEILCSIWKKPSEAESFFYRLMKDYSKILEESPSKLKTIISPGLDDSDISLAFCWHLVNAARFLSPGFAEYAVDQLESLKTKLKKKWIYAPYAHSLSSLLIKQDETNKDKTAERIEVLSREYQSTEMSVDLANYYVSIGYAEYLIKSYEAAAGHFYQAYTMGVSDIPAIVCNNLAYMLRRKEAHAYSHIDIIKLLDEAISSVKNEPLALVNKALYYVQFRNVESPWEKADECIRMLRRYPNGIDHAVNWWTECARNKNADTQGDKDRQEGALVLLWMMRYGFIPYESELADKLLEVVHKFMSDAPAWLKNRLG